MASTHEQACNAQREEDRDREARRARERGEEQAKRAALEEEVRLTRMKFEALRRSASAEAEKLLRQLREGADALDATQDEAKALARERVRLANASCARHEQEQAEREWEREAEVERIQGVLDLVLERERERARQFEAEVLQHRAREQELVQRLDAAQAAVERTSRQQELQAASQARDAGEGHMQFAHVGTESESEEAKGSSYTTAGTGVEMSATARIGMEIVIARERLVRIV
jgi:hypothetical protein